MTPPDRFDGATFDTYVPQTESQKRALAVARSFAAELRNLRAHPSLWTRLRRWIQSAPSPAWHGLYFVGPVGTGKTHLLAALYHALHPEVPCGFMHSSALFRQTEQPARFADRLANQYDALCLDEVEIDDPANEMRLVQLLRRLEERRVCVLATSNVAPEQFLANRMGPNRFERFLTTEFRQRYRLVFIRGDDYRRQTDAPLTPGRGWIGPASRVDSLMRKTYERDDQNARWMSFEAFREASRTTAHATLMKQLNQHDRLYLAQIAIRDTDDALRLLRVIDDLYLHPEAPALYFTAKTPPDEWFEATTGIAGAIAEKFNRTVSRLHAMCTIERVSAPVES